MAQIYDGIQSIGAMGADIELEAVSTAVNAIDFSNTGYAFLLDNSGKIITHPKQGYYGKNISELFTGSKPSIDKKLQSAKIGSSPVLTAFYPLQAFKGSEKKWYVGAVVDENKILAPAYELGRNAIIAAIITAIISSLGLFFYMYDVLIKPVAKLTEQADSISRGQLREDVDGLTRKDEIGDLANALQRLQKSLSMAMDRLRKTGKE